MSRERRAYRVELRANLEQRITRNAAARGFQGLLDRSPDAHVHARQQARVAREQLAANAAGLHQLVGAVLVLGDEAEQLAGSRTGFIEILAKGAIQRDTGMRIVRGRRA